ncbi:ribbon-helix-helix domain-containing protein [Nitrospirillum pindoramense]|uniref:Putative DNA-binding ribbon-helix-helix protein n=1 Tax=Nitrospirillum amazonense TaxID=28077 RepID=A0A560HA97_9PROT|nr:ribbon-helix-helix domain-containing protein [Nitrospirillum amazonense]TWB43262.1 putative DNA-binding ribbon-helix-helix protein [Nitrospirillum amazonense]
MTVLTSHRLPFPVMAAVHQATAPRSLVPRSVRVGTRRTSMRLEPQFWTGLDLLARQEGCQISELLDVIDRSRDAETSLSSAVRVVVVSYFQWLASVETLATPVQAPQPNLSQAFF